MDLLRVNSFASVLLFLLLAMKPTDQKPALYIIGDSTVKNGKGDGSNGQWGWGSLLPTCVDTAKLTIKNYALGGTSTRTFLTKGLWAKVLAQLKNGDCLLMQFGHNDGSPLDDTARARGTLKGIGDEEREIFNPITKQQERVYTYGWYLSTFIREAKARGVQVIVCSPIPRNKWEGNKIARDTDGYPKWAKEVAAREQVAFIPLHDLVADYYDQIGREQVNNFFPDDHTHTDLKGAQKNVELLAKAMKKLPQLRLKKVIKL
ncbi:rhamnogalacturonan acetylesterase [Olivibacter sp. XZL3]|uniref:rhamnogalacturonan acetylesterase n=1 Tax=Olivibacter sp. XZL3 TaxID=1735116 RepID=UPI00106647A3|nr:rhamnogalacturonan acetylesterase [Olivibacter sp. XZL3]